MENKKNKEKLLRYNCYGGYIYDIADAYYIGDRLDDIGCVTTIDYPCVDCDEFDCDCDCACD